MPLSTESSFADNRDDAFGTPPTSDQPQRGRWWRLGGSLAPLRVRDFRLLLSGQTISGLGDTFYSVALPWLVLTRGGGAQELGLVLAAYGIARIGTIIVGGVLSDKLGPRRVMLLSDIARALLVLLLTLVAARGGEPAFWVLCAITLSLGAFRGLFLPAYYAITPDVLPDDDLQAGNAINTSSIQLTALIGPALAGIVINVLQLWVALAVDAFSFVASALSLALMRPRRAGGEEAPALSTEEQEAPSPEEESGSAVQPPLTFWQLLRSSHLFQVVLLIVAITSLTFDGMMEVAVPALAHGPLDAGVNGYGLMLAAFGGGALIGALIAGSVGRIPRRGLVALGLLFLEAIAVAAVPFSGGLIGAILTLLVAGLTNGLLGTLFITMVQQLLPRHLLGRIMSALILATFGLYPLSVALAGTVAARWNAAVLFPFCGIAMLAAAALGMLQSEVREVQ